ncbi:hypothetical protein DEU56DRAFT_759011 [Suillus clintonianus]|uniref:uncharacterized protein n=1 Tax=Suillus clintonianus TaxID=1904413 RepID=UPI001B8663A8|nr:uncharacterized protein DEU56DRAFT_759011 [Suillus clintonianus]KAG2126044.1 hypothetical protein DEU56DRAFT_759011 [Suillus clintonianus]
MPPPPIPSSSSAHPSASTSIHSSRTRSSGELHLHELSMATDEISAGMVVPCMACLPTTPTALSTVPSTSPPSALTSASPHSLHSVLTSASRGKCKASVLGSDVDAPSGKRCRPPSATAKAQQEGTTAMTLLASAVASMSKSLAAPPVIAAPPVPPVSDFACAIEVLSEAMYLLDDDKLDMTQLFMKDKDEATVFLYLKGDHLKANWVQRKLAGMRTTNID